MEVPTRSESTLLAESVELTARQPCTPTNVESRSTPRSRPSRLAPSPDLHQRRHLGRHRAAGDSRGGANCSIIGSLTSVTLRPSASSSMESVASTAPQSPGSGGSIPITWTSSAGPLVTRASTVSPSTTAVTVAGNRSLRLHRGGQAQPSSARHDARTTTTTEHDSRPASAPTIPRPLNDHKRQEGRFASSWEQAGRLVTQQILRLVDRAVYRRTDSAL